MDEGTTLADLLSLNLHEFEDEVRNIVDKAVKEMSMEKVSTRTQQLSGKTVLITLLMSRYTQSLELF